MSQTQTQRQTRIAPTADARESDPPVTRPRWAELGLSRDDMLKLYRWLTLSRAVDDRIWLLNRQGKTAFVISSTGHETAQVGAALAFRPGVDIFFPYYRDMTFCLALGMTPKEIMLDQLAKWESPSSAGRQMPSHFSFPRLNIVSVSSPIATQLTQAAGAAYASKLLNDGRVTITFIGDGGTSKGDFHEALNFASTHKLPFIMFVENNGYAISVPQERQMNVHDISVRAQAYGIPGVTVDGTDPLAVYAATKAAHERALRGEGPTLIEAKVVRLRPHSSDDDDRTYRPQNELDDLKNKEKDPIEVFTRYLRAEGIITPEYEQQVKDEAKREVEAAQEYAEAAPFAPPEYALRFVYAEPGNPATGLRPISSQGGR